MYKNISKEILSYIESFGWIIPNEEDFINYIEANYVFDQRYVVENYMEAYEIKCSIDLMDWDEVCKENRDFVKLSNERYLNIYWIENDEMHLNRLGLIA